MAEASYNVGGVGWNGRLGAQDIGDQAQIAFGCSKPCLRLLRGVLGVGSEKEDAAAPGKQV